MNDLVMKTDWGVKREVLFTTDNKIKSIWEKFFKNQKRTTYKHIEYNKILNAIHSNMVRYNLINDSIPHRSILTKIVTMMYDEKRNFFRKHVSIQRFRYVYKYKNIRDVHCVYLVSFDQYFMSYLMQTHLLNDVIITDYLYFLFSETKENKEQKQKEIDNLFKKCKKILEGEEC